MGLRTLYEIQTLKASASGNCIKYDALEASALGNCVKYNALNHSVACSPNRSQEASGTHFEQFCSQLAKSLAGGLWSFILSILAAWARFGPGPGAAQPGKVAR